MRRDKLKELNSYIDELKVKRMQLLGTKGNFLGIESYLCELKNGDVIRREKLVKNKSNGNACIILPITTEGNVILVVQPRVFTITKVGVELPAGYVENGEDYETAARRELFEETGYVSKDLIPLASFYQDQGCSSSFNTSFLARNCKKISHQHLDEGEYIRYFECSYEEALELANMGLIADANSIITLEKAKQYLKK